jgi:cation transport ATPase
VRDHPGEKAKLAGQAVRMEWDPRTTASATDSGHGAIRSLAQPLYTSLLYALALIGIFVTARWFVGLALAVLAYQTVAAIVFVGATRYRIATDFLIALLAAGAIEWALTRWRRRLP